MGGVLCVCVGGLKSIDYCCSLAGCLLDRWCDSTVGKEISEGGRKYTEISGNIRQVVRV